MVRGSVLIAALVAVAASSLVTAMLPVPSFAPDRYPTGVTECSWLNWIADRSGEEDLNVAKRDIVRRVRSMNMSEWIAIGNGILGPSTFDAFEEYVMAMPCVRNHTLIASCVGLSDIGCKFQNFTSNDSTVMFLKTDGAVASPPNHKVVAENSDIRVINVYAPPGGLETAFHTHTRLSFWITYGVPRGERYYRYDGKLAFDAAMWDRKAKPTLTIAWNGPEWFHLLEEKEADPYFTGAPGNCPVELAPNCSNGFKYRIELKLDPTLDNNGMSLLRRRERGQALMV